MPKRALGLLLVAVGIAVAWAGCGDASRTVSTASLDRAEFVKRADAICARGRLRSLRYQPSGAKGQPEGKVAVEAIETVVLPAIQSVVDEIYDLGAPRGEAARIEAFLVAFQHAVDEGGDLSVPSFERLEPLFAPAGELARKQGLESCAYG